MGVSIRQGPFIRKGCLIQYYCIRQTIEQLAGKEALFFIRSIMVLHNNKGFFPNMVGKCGEGRWVMGVGYGLLAWGLEFIPLS